MESISSNLEKLVEKEIKRVEDMIKNIVYCNVNCKEIMINMNSYFNDSKFFFEKKDFLNAFEAIIICWSYLDCLLKLGLIKI